MPVSPFAIKVLDIVASLDRGEVVSYGEVAAMAGAPTAARAVGNVLHTHGGNLPWWRVVTVNGRLVPGMEAEHAALLRDEGIATADGHVVGFEGRGRLR